MQKNNTNNNNYNSKIVKIVILIVKIETKIDTLLQIVDTLIRKNHWYKLDKPDKFTEFKQI